MVSEVSKISWAKFKEDYKLSSTKSSSSEVTKLSNNYTEYEQDDSRVKYQITSDAGNVNEAKKEVEQAEKEGKKLSEILTNLISKCDEKTPKMSELEKELQSYGAEIEKTIDENGKVTSKAKSNVDEIQAKMQEQEEQINQKRLKISHNNLDIVFGKDKEAKNRENQQLKSEIESISAEYKANGADIENIIASSRATVGANEEAVKSVADRSSAALTEAINANEYAEEAIDKGYQAVTLKKDGDTLADNGYNPVYYADNSTYNSGGLFGIFGSRSSSSSSFRSINSFVSFGYSQQNSVRNDLRAIGLSGNNDSSGVSCFGFGRLRIDFERNIKQGNEAIAKGSKLGEASTTIANQVKSIASKYDFAINSGSGIDELANKSYQNTDILDKVDEVAEKHKDNQYGNDIIKNAKREAYASVADKVVAERKKAEEEAKKAH